MHGFEFKQLELGEDIQKRPAGSGMARVRVHSSHFTSLDVRRTLGFTIDFAFKYD